MLGKLRIGGFSRSRNEPADKQKSKAAARPLTLNEFKFKKRADFIMNFYKEIHKMSLSFTRILNGKENDEDYSSYIAELKESYFQIVHFYEKFYTLYIKDSETSALMNRMISKVKEINELSDRIVFSEDISTLKSDFKTNLDAIVDSSRQMCARLNSFGMMMWI